ncbi:MAG: hypothetical protein NT126_07185 [Bacteroidetes bacterium]|nr:hypothetical protein [Bacteroidota bacterium]
MMTIEKLKQIDDSLNGNNSSEAKILKNLRGYYFYYNEPTIKDRKNLIHIHFCGRCAYGTGILKDENKEPGKNGVWIGPFSTVTQVNQFVKKNFCNVPTPLEKCSCISKYPNNNLNRKT